MITGCCGGRLRGEDMSQKDLPNNLLRRVRSKRIFGYATAFLGIFAVTALLEPVRLQISVTTVALSLLLMVLFIATIWGSRPAFVASVVGMLCFNYFFLPPVGTWTIADPENWVALGAFLVIALTAGQLSARLKQRAEEAEAGRQEIKRLYDELNDAFERASHAEALKQSEKLKTALLDAVTHDIRTPLTSIKASVTTLLDEQGGSSQNSAPAVLNDEMRREMLEVINEEADRLNNFVEGMLELAKIEAGEIEFRRQWDAVGEIIAAAISRAEPLLRRHKIRVEIEKDLPVIRVDSRAVTEVLYTLVDNAAKYSPDETTILIAARRFDDASIIIAVEDEGQGLPPELRERVFDKFFRATRDGDAGGGRQPPGSGVGLAIAKGIVEAHEGKIWIVEGKKGGARFEFTLPVGDEDEVLEKNQKVILQPDENISSEKVF
jgi:K+-sensing histidine kinase KdpD